MSKKKTKTVIKKKAKVHPMVGKTVCVYEYNIDDNDVISDVKSDKDITSVAQDGHGTGTYYILEIKRVVVVEETPYTVTDTVED